MHLELQGFLGRSVVGVPRRTAVFLTVLTVTLSGLGLCSAGARADTSQLCAGYADCSLGSFTTHGYQSHEDTSWWRMYAGDNCTNYAAYVEATLYNVPEPTYLLGDAYQWATNAAANGVPVDRTPIIGSVAVWGSDASGMGYYGHVAVVEAIGPDDSYIEVSQSGMGTSGDGYDWERVDANGSSWESWPESFIHFYTPPAHPTPDAPKVSWPAANAPSSLSWTRPAGGVSLELTAI
jgi:surface antigen